MKQPILTPDRFAALFNSVVPCGLIGRYGYYGHSDIEIVRAILQYEWLRQEREKQDNDVRIYKRCGETLPDVVGIG